MGYRGQSSGEKRVRAVGIAGLVIMLAANSVAQARSRDQADRSRRTVLISIPDRQLAVLENGAVIASFRVAVGAAISPSPTGDFTIVNRIANPAYYHAGAVIPAGDGNPLGTRWLGLSQRGYGIHGTNAPRSVGHARSHGCIRLRNHDVELLFAMLRVGDDVKIRGERDEQVAQILGGDADETTAAEAEIESAAGGQ